MHAFQCMTEASAQCLPGGVSFKEAAFSPLIKINNGPFVIHKCLDTTWIW